MNIIRKEEKSITHLSFCFRKPEKKGDGKLNPKQAEEKKQKLEH